MPACLALAATVSSWTFNDARRLFPHLPKRSTLSRLAFLFWTRLSMTTSTSTFYEFIVIIINLYFCILRMQETPTKAKFLTSNGYVIHAMSDNTSALSWMRHASRSRAAPTRNLALFLVTFLYHANSLIPLSTHGYHVPGKSNEPADALSRPQEFQSYNDVWTAYEVLRPLQCYQVPPSLTAMLNSCLSPKLIPGWRSRSVHKSLT